MREKLRSVCLDAVFCCKVAVSVCYGGVSMLFYVGLPLSLSLSLSSKIIKKKGTLGHGVANSGGNPFKSLKYERINHFNFVHKMMRHQTALVLLLLTIFVTPCKWFWECAKLIESAFIYSVLKN